MELFYHFHKRIKKIIIFSNLLVMSALLVNNLNDFILSLCYCLKRISHTQSL